MFAVGCGSHSQTCAHFIQETGSAVTMLMLDTTGSFSVWSLYVLPLPAWVFSAPAPYTVQR